MDRMKNQDELLQVGGIASTHGLVGEVKVFPTTDHPEGFKKWKTLILDTGKEKKEVHIASAKFFKQFVILKMKEFNRIEEVEGLRKATLWIRREQSMPCKKDEYFVADLIGMEVFDENGSFVGELVDVMQTGANDVYIVNQKISDGKDGEKVREILLPAIRDCIKKVDVENNRMDIFLMPGLI